jgi:hypothetical protein
MADGDGTTAAGTTTTTDEPGNNGDAGKTFTQEQVNDLIAREKGNLQRKYGDYDDLKSKASKFDELTEAQKTDLERVTGERDTFKTTAEQTQTENLRLRVAVEKNLPAELIDRLRGGTKEEMEADADQLLELVTARREEPAFNGGARTAAQPEDDMNTRLRAAARGGR